MLRIVIDPLIDPYSRAAALHFLFRRLRFGESCVVFGLNDVGKTTLLGLLQSAECQQRFTEPGLGTSSRLLPVLVDGNHLQDAGEAEVLLVMAGGLRDAASRAGLPEAAALAQSYLDRESASLASKLPVALEFGSLLSQIIERCQLNLAFLFDEFDGVYRRMPARVALTLRAFDNQLGPRLSFLLAIDEPLERLRQGGTGQADTAEFEELFIGHTLALQPLALPDAEAFASRYFSTRRVDAPAWLAGLLARLSGGHPGLLRAACAAAERLAPNQPEYAGEVLCASAEVRAECENVWARLPAIDREAIDAAERERPHGAIGAALESLRERGLLAPGAGATIAIPILRAYLDQMRERRAPGLWLDPQTGEVRVLGKPPRSPLGPTEFRLLAYLYGHAGTLVRKDDVARAVWPDETHVSGIDDARIDKLVDRLRAKIELDPRAPRFVVTVRGFGYRLETGT